jgi:hypothetical protein
MSNVAIMEPGEPERRNNSALTPLAMLNRAMETGASMEVLEKFMSLHERWEAGNARKAFDTAISEAKAEIPPIVKNAKGHNDKRYANFAAIAGVVDPILSKHGLSYRFRTAQTDKISVTCVLSHRDGHSEETTLAGPADNSGSKNAIQAIGSTLTYLQRYSLIQALGLAATEDDDGRAAGAGGAITDEQVERLQREIMDTDSDLPKFLAHMKVETLAEIPAARFDAAMQALSRKRRQANG